MSSYCSLLSARALLLVSVVFSCAASVVEAAPGDFDRQFGTQGKVVFSLAGYALHAGDAKLQADGKILFAGSAISPTGAARTVVARFLSSGELDSTFGTAGVAVLRAFENTSFIRADSLSLLSSGAIRVGGQICAVSLPCDAQSAGGLGVTVTIAALTASGTVDAQFANSGIFTDNNIRANGWAPVFTATIPAAADATVGPETTTVLYEIGGFVGRFPAQPVLTRLSVGGIQDVTFPPASTIIPIGGYIPNSPTNALLAVSGRKVLIGGAAFSRLVRFSADGSKDETFGQQGVVEISDTNEGINSIVVTPANKLLVLTRPFSGSINAPALAQLSIDGIFDTSFAAGGKKRLDSLGVNPIAAVMDDSGRVHILATKSASDLSLVVARLNSQFGLDTSFGGGTVPVGFGLDPILQTQALLNEAGGLIKQPDGKLIAFGANGGSLVLVRLLTASDAPPPAGTSSSDGGCFGPTINSKVDPILPFLVFLGFLGVVLSGRNRSRQ